MSRYLVEHRHTEATCPSTTEPGVRMMADMVLGPKHAEASGVRVVGDYLVREAGDRPGCGHRLLLVVEAKNPENAEAYAAPFRQVGPTTVHELSACETVMHEALLRLGVQA